MFLRGYFLHVVRRIFLRGILAPVRNISGGIFGPVADVNYLLGAIFSIPVVEVKFSQGDWLIAIFMDDALWSTCGRSIFQEIKFSVSNRKIR